MHFWISSFFLVNWKVFFKTFNFRVKYKRKIRDFPFDDVLIFLNFSREIEVESWKQQQTFAYVFTNFNSFALTQFFSWNWTNNLLLFSHTVDNCLTRLTWACGSEIKFTVKSPCLCVMDTVIHTNPSDWKHTTKSKNKLSYLHSVLSNKIEKSSEKKNWKKLIFFVFFACDQLIIKSISWLFQRVHLPLVLTVTQYVIQVIYQISVWP